MLSPFQQFSTDGSYGTFDLESTLIHEIGHMLGLRHSGVLGAVMADSIPKNGVSGTNFSGRVLSESDAALLHAMHLEHPTRPSVARRSAEN